MSNTHMATGRVKWLAPLMKDVTSWAVFLWGLATGGLSTILFAGLPIGRGEQIDWSKNLGLGLLGFVPLLASLLALRNRRQAALLYLLSAPLVAVCFGWEDRLFQRIFEDTFSFQEFSLVFAGSAALLLLPGLFWLITSRWGWQSLIGRGISAEYTSRQPLIFTGVVLLILVLACTFTSLYLPFDFNCYKGGRPVSIQTSPRHTVFTGRVLTLGRPLHSRGCPWALLRVEHIYWGLPRWMSGMVIVRGYFRETDKDQEYFVDAYRSDGVLTRFIPVVEFYPCCHTTLLKNAEVDLRVLQDGPPKSGVRIIGRVYDLRATNRGAFVPDSPILVTGPAGPISTLTDKAGIYDLRDLPPGHYSMRVGLRDYGADLKTGDIWEEYLYLPAESSH